MTGFEKEYYDQPKLWKEDLLNLPSEYLRINTIISLIPSEVRTILDAGCGNGAFLNALPYTYESTGIDLSEEALKYVKTKKMRCDISEMPFENSSFDLVTCLEVLEHLPFDVYSKALFELERVSKKYIIISVPNNEALDMCLVICPECRCHYNPYRHVRSFDSEKLGTLFKKFSLICVKETGPIQKHYRGGPFLFSAYRLWKKALPPRSAVCPQCGYQVKVVEELVCSPKGNLNFMAKFLKYFYEIIFRPKYHRRWLVGLYKNKAV